MSNFDRLKNIYVKNKDLILPIKSGMFLEIHENVGEGDNKRIFKFKALVIKVKKPNHPDGTFTVRGEVARMVIEKIYPLSFSNFDKLILLDNYKIRRSKLYYIRTKIGKDAKFKSVVENVKKGTDLMAFVKNEEKLLEEKNQEHEKVEEQKKEIENTKIKSEDGKEKLVNNVENTKKLNKEENKE